MLHIFSKSEMDEVVEIILCGIRGLFYLVDNMTAANGFGHDLPEPEALPKQCRGNIIEHGVLGHEK